MSERDEGRAIRAIEAEMGRRGWDVADIVRASEALDRRIDPGTVGDFLNGKRWPRRGSRGTIEAVFDLPFGSIEDLAAGRVEEIFIGIDVGAPEEDDGWRFQRPEGIDEEAWRTLRAEFDGVAEVLVRKYRGNGS